MVTMLTTVDNPFNPFDDFDEWDAYDRALGYHTMQFLARVVKSSHELSDADQELAIDVAIAEIVSENVLGVYKLLEKEVASPTEDS